jgi:DNA gyrase subunit A
VPSNGKIAIKLEENDHLVSARICEESQHILLSARSGKSIRFPVDSVRQFKSRTSTGVRGMKLVAGDKITSMTVLNATEQDMETRDIYLKIPVNIRAQLSSLIEEAKEAESDETRSAIEADIQTLMKNVQSTLSSEVILQWAEHEQFILALTENGFGKRTSAYEYRITNRGGSGIVNIITSARNGKVISSYCVEESHDIILITTRGKLIRCSVKDIRIAGRNTQGVTIFRLEEEEKVISVALVEESNRREEEEEGEIIAVETSSVADQHIEISKEDPSTPSS